MTVGYGDERVTIGQSMVGRVAVTKVAAVPVLRPRPRVPRSDPGDDAFLESRDYLAGELFVDRICHGPWLRWVGPTDPECNANITKCKEKLTLNSLVQLRDGSHAPGKRHVGEVTGGLVSEGARLESREPGALRVLQLHFVNGGDSLLGDRKEPGDVVVGDLAAAVGEFPTEFRNDDTPVLVARGPLKLWRVVIARR